MCFSSRPFLVLPANFRSAGSRFFLSANGPCAVGDSPHEGILKAPPLHPCLSTLFRFCFLWLPWKYLLIVHYKSSTFFLCLPFVLELTLIHPDQINVSQHFFSPYSALLFLSCRDSTSRPYPPSLRHPLGSLLRDMLFPSRNCFHISKTMPPPSPLLEVRLFSDWDPPKKCNPPPQPSPPPPLAPIHP